MGKKDKLFNLNSLVFAKVKGYPFWPAKVTKVMTKAKYSVFFYGTGETANVKVEDLVSYVECKEKFVNDKILKRARYKEALEQIEAALSGDDPSPISTHVSENGDEIKSGPTDEILPPDGETIKSEPGAEAIKTEPDTASPAKTPKQNKGAKDSKAAQNKNKLTDPQPPPPANEDIVVKIERPEANNLPQIKAEPSEDAPPDESLSPEVEVTSRSGRKIKPKKYLLEEVAEELPAIATPKRKLTTSAEDTDEFTPAPKAKVVKVAKATIAASKKAAKEKGLSNHKLGDAKASDAEIMREEVILVETVTLIRTMMGIEKPNVDGCIELLKRFQLLSLTPLMLLKNPICMQTIKRLRKYVGNTKHWGYTDDEMLDFNEKAKDVRMLSEDIYKQVKKLFVINEGTTFWAGFNELLEAFDEETKDLSEEDRVRLTVVPESLKSSLLPINQKSAMELLSSPAYTVPK